MSRDEVNSRVKNVIAHVLEINVDEIGDEANFVTDLGATSIQSIRLVAGFEEEFNIEMDEDKSLQVQTVSGAVRFISSYVIPVQ
jgi:acyl carrier protein